MTSICAVGLKGLVFVQGLLNARIGIDRIVSYPQDGDAFSSFQRLVEIAADQGIMFEENRRPELSREELTLVVGWQFLFREVHDSVVVFHDSILPRYRGFAPTVTALINGDNEIGVTALAPRLGVDSGPIVAQARYPVRYPIKIEQALRSQAALMVELGKSILQQWQGGPLSGTEQDETQATFSLWRDEADYQIDWSASATAIWRFVDAVGSPYAGARTTANGQAVVIDDVCEVEDLQFERRDVGKVWSFQSSCPVVVCGKGMLRIETMRTASGELFSVDRLRSRLGK